MDFLNRHWSDLSPELFYYGYPKNLMIMVCSVSRASRKHIRIDEISFKLSTSTKTNLSLLHLHISIIHITYDNKIIVKVFLELAPTPAS